MRLELRTRQLWPAQPTRQLLPMRLVAQSRLVEWTWPLGVRPVARMRLRQLTARPVPTSRQPTRNEAAESEPGRSDPAGLASLRLRINLGYDGSHFHGVATQAGLDNVPATLEAALWRAIALDERPALTVAGRTDAGVHARGQVAHLDVPAEKWQPVAGSALRRLARLLPPAIRVHAIAPAPDGFDARFSALWRRYSYRVCDDPAFADPLRRHDTLWYSRPLDLDRMNEAAQAC